MLADQKQLLQLIQTDFPLVARPWEKISQKFGTTQTDVLATVKKLYNDGVIRRIAGVFNASMLGYQTTLAAAAAKPDNIETVAVRITQNPNVSHCYQRSDDDYPIWFTLACKNSDINKAVEKVALDAGCDSFLILPCEKRFKLGVIINPADGKILSKVDTLQPREITLSDEQKLAAVALQTDLTAEEEPFAKLAETHELTTQKLLELAHELLDLGVMRRYAAIVNHGQMGLNSNVMAAWLVNPNDARLEQVAQLQTISHCYIRPAQPSWPFNFYTMIHSSSREGCLNSVAEISEKLGNPPHRLLWSVKEFKKSPVIYR